MPWDMSKAETNQPLTPKQIAVWRNIHGLHAASTPDANTQQNEDFKASMYTASEGIKRANKERLERTKELATRRKHGTDGQKRF